MLVLFYIEALIVKIFILSNLFNNFVLFLQLIITDFFAI